MDALPAEQFQPNTEGVWAGLADTIYHSQTDAPGISRGLVVELLQKSPAHAAVMLAGLGKKKVTPAMTTGTLMDKALLEPDKFKEGLSHWVKPAGMKLSTKEGIAWKADHPGLPYIPAETESMTQASVVDIKEMIESIMRHKIAKRIVEQSVKQESAFCTDPDTGLLRKCRPDTRLEDNNGALVLADLKTTFPGGAAADAWSMHCARMSYHLQDSFYSDIYRDLLGTMPFFVFIVVERKLPYAVRMFQVHQDGKVVAREKYKRALEEFRKCKETGIWPAYDESIQTIRLPKWELQPANPIELE